MTWANETGGCQTAQGWSGVAQLSSANRRRVTYGGGSGVLNEKRKMKWLIYKSEFVFQIRGPANKHGAKTLLTGRGNEMFTDGWGGEDDTRHSFGWSYGSPLVYYRIKERWGLGVMKTGVTGGNGNGFWKFAHLCSGFKKMKTSAVNSEL